MSLTFDNRLQALEKDQFVDSGSTLTLTEAAHAGKTIRMNQAAGVAITLPPATGSGNRYPLVTTVSVTSNTSTIKVANASDIMSGVATMGSAGGTSLSTGTATTSDTVTFNGTTQGGLIGTRVELVDVAANIWNVEVHGVCSGVAITPFSATV
jgi:hypothetical protein